MDFSCIIQALISFVLDAIGGGSASLSSLISAIIACFTGGAAG